MNPHMKVEKERRLRLVENALASAQQKLDNPKLSKEAKSHLKARQSRFEKERKELRKELGLEKSEEVEREAKPKRKSTKKTRGGDG